VRARRPSWEPAGPSSGGRLGGWLGGGWLGGGWLVGWLVGGLVGWLVGWVVGWWVGWLVGWSVGQSVGRFQLVCVCCWNRLQQCFCNLPVASPATRFRATSPRVAAAAAGGQRSCTTCTARGGRWRCARTVASCSNRMTPRARPCLSQSRSRSRSQGLGQSQTCGSCCDNDCGFSGFHNRRAGQADTAMRFIV
jgi:hypothetical protein